MESGDIADPTVYATVLRPSNRLWTYLSPAEQIGPGERTARFRVGGDQPVLDRDGRSRISFETPPSHYSTRSRLLASCSGVSPSATESAVRKPFRRRGQGNGSARANMLAHSRFGPSRHRPSDPARAPAGTGDRKLMRHLAECRS